jgi:hemerythrin
MITPSTFGVRIMPFVQWGAEFVTGIQQFDEHHQHLVELLNKTYDDFICGAPDENLGVILNELVEYARYHFTAEEAWMQEHSYLKQQEHKNEHEKFSRSIVNFQNAFQSGNVNITLEVLTFLKRWLHNHILESDAGYATIH